MRINPDLVFVFGPVVYVVIMVVLGRALFPKGKTPCERS